MKIVCYFTVAIHGPGHDPGDLARACLLGLAVACIVVGGVKESIVTPSEIVSPCVAAKCLKHSHYSSASGGQSQV